MFYDKRATVPYAVICGVLDEPGTACVGLRIEQKEIAVVADAYVNESVVVHNASPRGTGREPAPV
jgi:hypothetical protein